MEKTKRKYSKTDRLILGIGFTLLGLFVLSIAIPIVYVILASFMDPTVLNNQGLSFRFKDWTIDAYRRVLENEMIWRGFINSFLYSLAFTVISVLVTLLVAYPMSKKNFVGRKLFNLIVHDVLRRRNDPDFYPDQSAASGKYGMGDLASGSIQCLEYDSCKNLLSVCSD